MRTSVSTGATTDRHPRGRNTPRRHGALAFPTSDDGEDRQHRPGHFCSGWGSLILGVPPERKRSRIIRKSRIVVVLPKANLFRQLQARRTTFRISATSGAPQQQQNQKPKTTLHDGRFFDTQLRYMEPANCRGGQPRKTPTRLSIGYDQGPREPGLHARDGNAGHIIFHHLRTSASGSEVLIRGEVEFVAVGKVSGSGECRWVGRIIWWDSLAAKGDDSFHCS